MNVNTTLDQTLESIKRKKIIQRKEKGLDTKQDLSFNFQEECEVLEKNIQREKRFYNVMIAKITHAIHNWGPSDKKKLILFDLDHTMVADGESIIRVGGEVLLHTLQKEYKDETHIGLCSNRSHDGIIAVFDRYPHIFGTEYIDNYMFSAREDDYKAYPEQELIDQGRGKQINNIFYFKKVNLVKQIQIDYPDMYPILIDDIIDESFEEKQVGIIVPKNLVCVFEMEGM